MPGSDNKNICKRCATCCSYFSIPMDPPEGEEDYDDLAWMLIHENVIIHVGKETWDIVVKNSCRYLDPSKGCMIYERRPQICRNHLPGECDANATHDGDYDGIIATIKDIDELYRYQINEKKKVA